MTIWPLSEIIDFTVSGRIYAIAVIDLDFFTRFCRSFNSFELDDIMKNIGAFLAVQLPNQAKMWRSDGDEFLIAILNQERTECQEMFLQIKQHFRKQKFARNSAQTYSNVVMTFSAGIASFPDDGADVETVIKKAVVGLFLAKAFRRNKVIGAPDMNMLVNGNERVLYNQGLQVNIETGAYGEIGSVEAPAAALSARLWEPQSIDTDESGNLYIVDQNNHSILKYDGNIVQRIAGTGQFGYSGDNGPGTYATLNKPTGLTVHQERLYITDTGNDAVRLLNLRTGVITTFAGLGQPGYSGDGGLAINAGLNKPGGCVVDMDGNVYINDIANNVIRKVDRENQISTYAGNGQYGYSGDGGPANQATFAEIYGLGIHKTLGYIYLADYYNHCIRKIDIATGIITTIAGSGEEGYRGDGGDARQALLNRPVAVCADKDDNLYIAESGNSCIRFYESKTKKLYTLAGDGVIGIGAAGPAAGFRFANPNGVAIGKGRALSRAGALACDLLYILDGANNRVCSIKLEVSREHE